jgi:glycosidase
MKIASLIQYTLPGVPSVYYGDEIGMQGLKDPFNRKCMDWDNPNEELLKWYRRLGEIRRGCNVFVSGEFIPVYCEHKTIAYKRSDEHSEVIVAVNLDEATVSIPVGDEWNNSYSFFGAMPTNGVINIGAHSYVMLTRDK